MSFSFRTITRSAPSPVTGPALAAVPTVATTVAPASLAHWISAPATPPEAAGTSTRSPGRTRASRFIMCHAVLTTHCPAVMASGSSPGSSDTTTSAGTLTSSP